MRLADFLVGVGVGVLLRLAINIARHAWRLWRGKDGAEPRDFKP